MLAHGVAALRGARLSDQYIHICATLSITLHGTGRITGLPGPLQDADVGRIISRNKRVKVELRHCNKDPTARGQRTALEHVARAERLQCRRHRIAIHDDARELHALLVIPCKSRIAYSR